MRGKFSLLALLFFCGCTCSSSFWISEVVHDPALNQLNATFEMSCGSVHEGLVNFALLENYTSNYILNGTVFCDGAFEDGFYTIPINGSSVQLNPYWQYKLWLTLPGNVEISRTFNAEEPLDWCTLKPVSGTGSAHLTKYYFNQTTHECEGFVYTGQRAVAPFDSLDECESACLNSSIAE